MYHMTLSPAWGRVARTHWAWWMVVCLTRLCPVRLLPEDYQVTYCCLYGAVLVVKGVYAGHNEWSNPNIRHEKTTINDRLLRYVTVSDNYRDPVVLLVMAQTMIERTMERDRRLPMAKPETVPDAKHV
jgi:hypothetical protein